MVLTFVNSLVPTVRRALCDHLPEVRAAAAKTFDSLHNTVGSRYVFFSLWVPACLKVSKSQKQIFLKPHCPKNERNICQIFCSFFGQWSFKKKCF